VIFPIICGGRNDPYNRDHCMETRLNRASALESRLDRNFLTSQQTGGLEHTG